MSEFRSSEHLWSWVGEGCLVSSAVSSVQDEKQNQEHEEKGRRRKQDKVTPLVIDPPPVHGVFLTAPGAEEGGSDVL